MKSEYVWFSTEMLKKACFQNPLCMVVLTTLASKIDESNKTYGVHETLQPLCKEHSDIGRALCTLERDGILRRDELNDCVEFDPLYVACEVPEGV